MSGGSGGYGGSTRPTTDCNIVEVVPLTGPVPAVVATLKVGDELDVEAVSVPSGGKSIVAKHGPAIAGALVPKAFSDLLECMEAGHTYMARVVKRRGGLCEVEVRPR